MCNSMKQATPDQQTDVNAVTSAIYTSTSDYDDDPCTNCTDHACEYGSCSMSRG